MAADRMGERRLPQVEEVHRGPGRKKNRTKQAEVQFANIVREVRRIMPDAFTVDVEPIDGESFQLSRPVDPRLRRGDYLQLNSGKYVQVRDSFLCGSIFNPRRRRA